MEKKLNFIKLAGKWFVHLPDYPGHYSELEMVLGADVMCDMIDKFDTGHITVTVSDELVTSSDYDLLLGKVTYDGSDWSVNFNTTPMKFKSDNIQINLPNNSGLVKNNQVYEGSFSNWLRDSFIFDDGNLGDYTQSIDEIFVEYTNGITLNIPTSGLSTTFNGNMIPSVSDVKCLTIPTYFTEIVQGALAGASNLKELTIPFVGDSIKTAEDTYQYPFGYIFGTTNYDGATATTQIYRGSSIDTQTTSIYYIGLVYLSRNILGICLLFP